MTAVSKVQDVYFCDGCGNPYVRKTRKPQSGRKQYCGACGEQVASKNRQARYRQTHQQSIVPEKQIKLEEVRETIKDTISMIEVNNYFVELPQIVCFHPISATK